MKKKMLYILLLLVNTLLLAHIIVPHHHHQLQKICFLAAACHSGHDNSSAGDCEVPCHDNTASSDECLIKDILLRDYNERVLEKQDIQYIVEASAVFLYTWNKFLTIPDEVSPATFERKPYLNFYHSAYIARATGLRAPPVC